MESSWNSHFIILDNIRSEEIGAKARSLLRVLESDVAKIPLSLCVDDQVFTKFCELWKIEDVYSTEWSNLQLPLDFSLAILETIQNIFGDRPIVVRSSATCEDSPILSFAGQYSTFLNVTDPKQILNAIQKVYQSFGSRNAFLYSSIKGVNLNKEKMCILIQEVSHVTHSGVLFTRHPVTLDESVMIVEYTTGLGDKLVAGEIVPTYLEIDKQQSSLLNRENIEWALYNLGITLEEKFGFPVDVEWGWDGHQIIIFQVRPITVTKSDVLQIGFEDAQWLGKGKVACAGIAIGKFKHIIHESELQQVDGDDIIYCERLPNNLIFEAVYKAAGVITHGGILSHIAVVAREFGKTCLVDPLEFDLTVSIDKKLLIDSVGNIYIHSDV